VTEYFTRLWSTNCSTTSSASRLEGRIENKHTRRLTPRPRTPKKVAAPSSSSSHDRATASDCGVECQRSCDVDAHAAAAALLLERLADLAFPPRSRPSSRPQIDRCRVSARHAVEGAHAAQHPRFGRERAQPARLIVPIRMFDKLVPQLRAQVRPHLPGEAGARGAQECAPARRAAPPREARKRGEVAAAVEAVFEGARRAGSGVNEEMGESRAESLWSVGDVGDAVGGGRVGRRGRVGRAERRRGAPWPLAKVRS
jgi:hypothetical protein